MFQKWCESAGIGTLAEFLDSDLSGAPEPWVEPWTQVQRALKDADRTSQVRGPVVAREELERTLRRPPARVVIDSGALRQLTPVRRAEAVAGIVIPSQPVDRGQRRPMSAREALSRLGGIAGARAVADFLSEHQERPVTVRQVRDRFRNTGGAVRKLGAGYFATRERKAPLVLHWVESRLVERGNESVDDLVAAVLEAFPYGDARAVQAWLQQQPGVLTVRGRQVFFVDPAAGGPHV